jgi:hypothetical protein
LLLFLTGLSLVLWTGTAFAHAVAEGDKGYIQEISGVHLLGLCISAPNIW